MLYIVPSQEKITFNQGMLTPLIPNSNSIDDLTFHFLSGIGGKTSVEFVSQSDKTFM